eukprot:7285576-Alexandrium_andersonii.AAC.1
MELLTAMLAQNQLLLQHLTGKAVARDLFSALLAGGGEEESASSSSGGRAMRGFAARSAWQSVLRQQGPTVREAFQERLAQALN